MSAQSLSKSKGIFYMLGAMWVFASVNAISKDIVTQYSMIQIIFFRNAFALFPAWFLVRRAGGMASLATPNITHFIILGFVGLAGYLGLFMSLKLLPLADAVTLHFSETLFLTLLAPFVVQASVHWHRFLAVGVGFIGVVIMMRPTSNLMNTGALYALLFAVCDTFVMLSTRILVRYNGSSSIAFYYALMVMLASALFLPFYWVNPVGQDWLILMAIGVGGGIGQICVIQAYRYACASVVAPMMFTALLWSILYGFLFWGEIPDQIAILGAALIVSSGLFIIWRENQKAHD